MKATELRTLIKESIQEYIKEIDAAGNRAALEAKIAETQKAIDKRKKLTSKDGLDEAYHEFLDERKMKEMTSEIKLLEKSLTKYGKMLEKMDAKSAPKMEDESMMDEEVIDEVSIDELTADPNAGPQLEDLDEAKKKPSAGMTKKEKSALSKKAHAGKDIGKKGKGFEKVAKAGEKQYGSKEAGEKVAAAAMWKAAAKKESVETEGEVLNESFLHMQKLAGLITEAEYQKKSKGVINEVEKTEVPAQGAVKGGSTSTLAASLKNLGIEDPNVAMILGKARNPKSVLTAKDNSILANVFKAMMRTSDDVLLNKIFTQLKSMES